MNVVWGFVNSDWEVLDPEPCVADAHSYVKKKAADIFLFLSSPICFSPTPLAHLPLLFSISLTLFHAHTETHTHSFPGLLLQYPPTFSMMNDFLELVDYPSFAVKKNQWQAALKNYNVTTPLVSEQ